jgi:predicted enzyme related to lactoylglutathione lyase
MPKIVHFEINADDVSRAKDFYVKVFKWKIQSWEGNPDYHLIEAGEESEAGIDYRKEKILLIRFLTILACLLLMRLKN